MSALTNTNQPAWIDDTIRDLPTLLLVPEAAGVLRMSTRSVRRLMADGSLRSHRARQAGSARALIPRTEIARYLSTLAAGSAL
jgi:excisionase family DNA binding protein